MAEEHPVCSMCGDQKLPEAGRFHGKKFQCKACQNLAQLVRRRLGSGELLAEVSAEERSNFFRRSQVSASDSYQWEVVRANLAKTLTRARIEEEVHKTTAEELPLSVWLSRGFEEAVVRKCPVRTDSVLGEVFAVPVRALVSQTIARQVEEELVTKERALRCAGAQKRKRADGEAIDEMDVAACPVPADAAAGNRKREAEDKKEAREAAKALATAQRKNAQQNLLAAKSAAPLTSLCRALLSTTQEVQKHVWDVEPDFMKTLQDAQVQMSAYLKETTDYMHLYETTQGQGVELKPLTYTAQTLKAHTHAAQDVLGEAKDMVKAAKSAAQKEKQAAKQTAKQTAKAKPKPRAKGKAKAKQSADADQEDKS